jgi:hypothetical protein
MPGKEFETFFENLSNCLNNNEFIKITISDKRDKANELKNVSAKVVSLQSGTKLSFVYRYQTKDITKNYDFNEAVSLLKEMLEKDYYRADLFAITNNWHVIMNKNTNECSLTKKPPSITEAPVHSHDKIKTRPVTLENNIYLHELGITTADWKVKKDMNDKYRQINKYIEIIDGIISSVKLPDSFRIVDMGSGKGYLTFALYDYLENTKKLNPEILGIELRKELVEKCNSIAKKAGFEKLSFQTGSIEKTDLPPTDMLIALHACDTATDEAIFRGIQSNTKIIICAPCCHKQIRKQIKPVNELKEITKHGILEERQAEILTDAIRSLILEAHGYKTKVFEFISTEHTPKNVLIVGIKTSENTILNKEPLDQVKKLKALFGIESHYLEKLLKL